MLLKLLMEQLINYPFDASYVVGEPNVIVSPTAMNVMYMVFLILLMFLFQV